MRTGRDLLSRNGKKRAVRILLAAAFCAVFCFAMCIRTGEPALLSPVQVCRNMDLWLRLSAAEAFHLPLALQKQALIDASPCYLETIARFRNLLVTLLCGAAIAIGGAVFQILFKNPMAVPNMLGVGSGISLGLLILVLQFSVDAYALTTLRYVYCLGLAFLMLVLVLAAGRFAGKNRRSVTDMLLIGAVLSQVVGTVMTYLRFNMDQDDLIVYQNLSLYGFSMNTSYEFAGRSLLILLAVVAGCTLPVFLMRFSFNAMCFSEEETRSFGLNAPVVRTVCILTVTMMVTTATLYCGTIGALSLAVPHICRYLYGSRFKPLLLGSAFLGAFLLLICRAVSSLIYLDGMGFFPIGTLVGLVCAPILAMVLAQRRRGWE